MTHRIGVGGRDDRPQIWNHSQVFELQWTMPGCRRSIPNSSVPRKGGGFRLNHCMVDWKSPPRAANDNHWMTRHSIWPWAVAIGLAPIVSAAVLLAMSI
ncbi:hypothetical protein [uncultured Methylobacterium sp.]|uniref:hypothetical protein n=1 Tax=uncultured Methylobacterium sp. TaxID=157278 RepID=UPI0035CBFD91